MKMAEEWMMAQARPRMSATGRRSEEGRQPGDRMQVLVGK